MTGSGLQLKFITEREDETKGDRTREKEGYRGWERGIRNYIPGALKNIKPLKQAGECRAKLNFSNSLSLSHPSVQRKPDMTEYPCQFQD